MKQSIGAPFVRIVGAATGIQTASPFISEYDLFPIVRKRGRVPICVVRIVHGVQTLGMRGISDVEQDSISGAGARGQPDRRVDGDIVTLVAVGRLLQAVFAVGASAAQAVECAGTGIA